MVTTAKYEDLPRATRRRLLRRALLRPALSAAALFILYFTLPLDRQYSDLTLVGLLIGLIIFAVLLAVQTRAISRSAYPRLAAIEALAILAPLFVLLFATAYYLMERSVPLAFTQRMTRLDSLYFTMTVLSTVGFGDIAPRSQAARAVTTVQFVGDLVLLGLVVRVLLNAVQTGLARRSGEPADAPSAQSRTGTDS